MEGLPYFRFFPAEWVMGDITLCSFAARGLFIEVLSYYWIKECSITLAMLKQRFPFAKAELEELLKQGIFKTKGRLKIVEINFLDLQYDELLCKKKSRQDAGRKGGLKKKAKLKHCLSNAKAKPKLIEEIRIEEIRIEEIKLDTKEGERTPKDQAQEILDRLNVVTGKNYKDSGVIIQGLSKGRRLEDFHKIINTKLQDPFFKDRPHLMVTSTLFADKYWDKFVNQRPEDFKTPGGVSKDLTEAELLDSMKLEGDKKNG